MSFMAKYDCRVTWGNFWICSVLFRRLILFSFMPFVIYLVGRDYSTVDGRSKRKCYWTRASCDCGRLQIGGVIREVECMSNDYTNPNTNPKTLTTLALTLTDPHSALGSFCAPEFCDFVRNYSCTVLQ